METLIVLLDALFALGGVAAFGFLAWGGRLVFVHSRGFVAESEGRPVAVDVYPGNTGDPTTVPDQVDTLRRRFHLSRVVLVGENDTRCVPGQVYRYVRALRKAGGDVELYSYAEGHSSYIVNEEVREWAAVLDFLRARIRPP